MILARENKASELRNTTDYLIDLVIHVQPHKMGPNNVDKLLMNLNKQTLAPFFVIPGSLDLQQFTCGVLCLVSAEQNWFNNIGVQYCCTTVL